VCRCNYTLFPIQWRFCFSVKWNLSTLFQGAPPPPPFSLWRTCSRLSPLFLVDFYFFAVMCDRIGPAIGVFFLPSLFVTLVVHHPAVFLPPSLRGLRSVFPVSFFFCPRFASFVSPRCPPFPSTVFSLTPLGRSTCSLNYFCLEIEPRSYSPELQGFTFLFIFSCIPSLPSSPLESFRSQPFSLVYACCSCRHASESFTIFP